MLFNSSANGFTSFWICLILLLSSKVRVWVKDVSSLYSLEITFLSSFGLKVILELYKHLKDQDGILKLKNVSEQQMNSFTLVGLDKFLVCEWC